MEELKKLYIGDDGPEMIRDYSSSASPYDDDTYNASLRLQASGPAPLCCQWLTYLSSSTA